MRSLLLSSTFVVAIASTAFGQTSYPMLMSVHPVAAQRGATSEHTVRSRYSMYGAYQVLVSGAGVTGEVVPHAVKEGQKIPSLTNLKVKFTVAADAATGVRDFRLVTPRGVSTVGQLVVAADPIVEESRNNNTAEQAQVITLPATLCGTIERAEDVDFYRFSAAAGDRLSFHVRSMRLQDRIHDLQQHSDPLLTLRTAGGATLATADNDYFADPLLTHAFAEKGEYLLEIRDVRYQGNQYWEYSIEVNARPFVAAVHPLGVTLGETPQLALTGFHLLTPRAEIKLPAQLAPGLQAVEMPVGGDLSAPVPLVISELPMALETESPNDNADSAQAVSIPAGICGRIEREGDVDSYRFSAKKGDQFSFEVVARRGLSELDSLLQIYDAKGRRLTENDDLRLYKHTHADSWIESWTAPADADYVLQIRDLHLRGSEAHPYFIRATHPQPSLELYLDTDKTQLTPGTSAVLFANAVRKHGFAGEIVLGIEGLPPGVTASCGRILPGQRDGSIVLTAADDVSLGAAGIRVTGTAVHGSGDQQQTLETTAVVYQETYQPGGGRGHWPVTEHVVCVAEPGDLRAIRLSTTELSLKPGESKQVDVEIVRAPGFNKNVQLDPLFRHLSTTYANSLPPGVTIDAGKSRTLLTGTSTKGHIVFKAAANATPVERQQICVMANISLNFVMKWTYSSEPLFVTVAP